MPFIDEAIIEAYSGRGGSGCVAFRREKFVPRGGPSGGDGGRGGSVILIADEQLNTLFHLRGHRHYRAERGRHGEGSNRSGRAGADREVRVPLGTVVYLADEGRAIGELVSHGQRFIVAEGGDGGRGNARFATPTVQAPRRSEPGFDGEEWRLRLELKLLADVGLVGLPNAGKSTLISRISAAKPKIADYPFTTLVPQLGVVATGLVDEPFVVADLPGLIAGAAQGAGLGIQFLKHVERCRVLVHLVDLSCEGSAAEDLINIETELGNFRGDLLERHRFLVGSKLDSVREERLTELRQIAAERGMELFEISAVTGAGLGPLTAAIGQALQRIPKGEFVPEPPAEVVPPAPRAEVEAEAAAEGASPASTDSLDEAKDRDGSTEVPAAAVDGEILA